MGHTTVFRAFALACTIGAVGLWGCGSGGGGGGGTAETPAPAPEGYANITITAGANTSASTQSSRASSNDLSVLKDATGSATGGAGALAGPTSINDTSSVACTFTVTSTTTGGEGYTVRLSTGGACGNANECITCTLTGANTSAVSIACAGTVPSSAAAASEIVELQLVCTSTFATNMPANLGTIRFDATQSIADSFDLAGTTTVITGCDGGVGEMTATEITNATWWTDTNASFSDAYLLTDVANLDCVTVHTMTTEAVLTGVDTPNAAPTNNLGTVTFNAKICDDKDGSAVAKGSSVCAAGTP